MGSTGGGASADVLGGPVMNSAGFSFLFCFFCTINRGGLVTASKNTPFTMTFSQKRLGLTASVNGF